MANANRDQNSVPTLLAMSSSDGTPVTLYADPVTHRLLVDLPGGTGTVTSVSVATANGFAGTVSNPTTTPAITISTTVTGILKGNGTAISAATPGTDYEVPLTFSTGLTRATNTITNNVSTGVSGGQTIIGSTSTNSGMTYKTTTGVGTTGADHIFVGGNNGATELMRILNSGEVGIGTSSPSTLFKVKSNGYAGNLFQIENSGGSTAFTIDNNGLYAQFYNAGGINYPSLGFNQGVGISTAGATVTSNLGLCVNNSAKVIVTNANVMSPPTNNATSLGSATVSWSNLYLASTAVIGFGNGNVVLTHSSGVLTLTTGTLALGSNNLTMTGSIAATGARVTKGWFTDIESTNAPTVGGVALPTASSTTTLTNKRITKRVVTVNAPGATPTTNTNNADIAEFTGLNTAITSMTTNLSGTPVNGDMLEFIFLDDGTARGITWGASFADSGTVTLPTTTVISTALRVLVQYQTIASLNKWVCIAKA